MSGKSNICQKKLGIQTGLRWKEEKLSKKARNLDRFEAGRGKAVGIKPELTFYEDGSFLLSFATESKYIPLSSA